MSKFYIKLNPMIRRAVDRYAAELGDLPWQQRSHLLSQVVPSFTEELAPEDAPLAARGFITAILELWEEPRVVDPYQACLYLTSLLPEHQQLAQDFLEENPELEVVVARELASGGPTGQPQG
jgi:hypothetical protein